MMAGYGGLEMYVGGRNWGGRGFGVVRGVGEGDGYWG